MTASNAPSNFTPNQQAAIRVADRNLIVSAGAGAGKTSTLIERVYRLVSDPVAPVALEELLIVTFSRLAAQEMKTRLTMRLTAALESDGLAPSMRAHLEEQLYQLPRAPISTIHSFCLEMISSFPDRVGLAPGFDLMSEQETRLFRRDFVLRKIEECLEDEGECGRVLRGILDQFDPLGGVSSLAGIVIGLFDFIESIPDLDAFAALCRELHDCPDDGNPLSNPRLEALIRGHIAHMLTLLESDIQILASTPLATLPPALHEQVIQAQEVRRRSAELRKGERPLADIVGLVAILDLPRWPSSKEVKAANVEAFHALRDEAKAAMKDWAKRLQPFTPDALKNDFFSSSVTVRVMLEEVATKWNRELFRHHVAQRRLTFSHLERLALELLWTRDGRPSEVAEFYRRRFRFVMVDEFQDVNHLQEKLIEAVSRPAADGRGGNLFAVGDVKQSIYEFRQADPSLFLGRYDRSIDHDDAMAMPLDSRLNLVENFRSEPRLLAELNGLFETLLRRGTIGIEYRDGHAFKAGRAKATPPRPTAFDLTIFPREATADGEYESSTMEALQVAAQIEKIGPPWKDICILLRSTVGTASELVEALDNRNIPVFCDSRLGFLTAIEVIEFQHLLMAIENPYNDVALLAALRGPMGNWSEDELLLLRHHDRKAAFYANLRAVAENTEHPLTERAHRFLDRLTAYQGWSTRHSMADFFALLFDDMHLLERVSVRPGGDQRRQNLIHLQEQARGFDRFLRKGLGQFLDFLQDMIANDEDFAPPSTLPADADVVRILSIHRSKGMEFPIVFLPFTGRQFNEANLGRPFLLDRELGMASKLRDTVDAASEDAPPLLEIFQLHRKRKERAEELRLHYVALTRAREAIYISGAVKEPRERLEKLIERGRQPLSEPEIIAARSPLDWLLSHAARRWAINAPLPAGTLEIRSGIARFRLVSDEDAEATTLQLQQTSARAPEKLPEPSPELVADFGDARRRIVELAARPDRPRVRAKVTVTELKRAFDQTRDGDSPPYVPPLDHETSGFEWLPADLSRTRATKAANRGTATHRFLANMALEEIVREDRHLSDEAARLVRAGFLTEEEAALVVLGDIRWFLNSDLGKRMQRHAPRLQRERAFTACIDPSEFTADGLREPVVLQGITDLLFREPDGWVLVDYKTDNPGTGNERIPALLASYTPQLQLYRLLAERALREPVKDAWLVFLRARQTRQVPPAERTRDAVAKIIEAGAVVFDSPDPRLPSIGRV